jgi:hypothetical protein
MAQACSITRRSVAAGLALTAASGAVLAGPDNAYAQAKQPVPEKGLYERLGGVFAIAAVVDHFSDAVVKNPIVGEKSQKPATAGMAHQEPGKAARSQVHADAMGLQRFGRALPVHGHQARHDAARPGGGPPGTADLPRRI